MKPETNNSPSAAPYLNISAIFLFLFLFLTNFWKKYSGMKEKRPGITVQLEQELP